MNSEKDRSAGPVGLSAGITTWCIMCVPGKVRVEIMKNNNYPNRSTLPDFEWC